MHEKPRKLAGSYLSRDTAFAVLRVALIALFFQAIIACGMGFQPGWANGWPGVSKHTVFAGFASVIAFLMIVSAGAATTVLPLFHSQRFVAPAFFGRLRFATMLAWTMLAVVLSVLAFRAIRASAMLEWL